MIIGGCLNEKIKITPEYIINPNWSKKSEEAGSNTIKIRRMEIKKDSIINPSNNLGQDEILDKLEPDPSFSFFANVKINPDEDYKNKKIYFDKENDFYWIRDDFAKEKTKIIGKLLPNSWYEISKLNYYSYVIYIDTLDKVHCYIINQANY